MDEDIELLTEEELRAYGVKWLKKIKAPQNVIDAFEVDGVVSVSESGSLAFPADLRLRGLIMQAEQDSGCKAYYAIEQQHFFGLCLNVLVVPRYPEDIELCESDLDSGMAFAYVVNETAPVCSELGTIKLRKTKTGFMRDEV